MFRITSILAVALALPGQALAEKSATVQAGIQSIADELVKSLDAGKSTGFRRVAVLPFDTLDGEAKANNLGRICSELMSSRLAAQPSILQVERSRLESVVSELQMVERGEISAKGAASVGKLLGANSVVLGSIASAGANFLVTARVVDTETGEILTAADRDFPRANFVAFSKDVVVTKSKSGAAFRSAVAPGWGQVYNGDTGRGVAYGTMFAAAAGGAIASTIFATQAENDYNDNSRDTVDRRDDANEHYNRANLFLIGIGVVWAVAVTDAYLTGSDASTIELDLAPEAGGGASGRLLIGGRF